MGVINLGNLVSKLKNSLSGTFVKKTDKASKTKFGVVKIGNGIDVASGVISVTQQSSGIDLLVSGDFTETITADATNLKTAVGKNLKDYKFLAITSTGSTDGSTSTAFVEVNDTLGMMGFNLNSNGNAGMIQFNLAKSSGSEVFDSIYCSYASYPGKWGNIYGIK